MDLISVIVPIYKVEQYLDGCVRSIVEQTYENLDIILVDDGSPDNCPAMCDAWAEKDSRIRVIHKENGGLSDARNAGLAVAAGEYIAFVDSDDWIEPDFIRTLYEIMTESGAQIAECATRLVDEAGDTLKMRGVSKHQILDAVEALERLILEDGIYQTVWNKLYRREVIDGILFEKGKHHEDDFWTYQVFDRAANLAATPLPLYNYLQRKGSIIGAGYTLKRLDGLEARRLRMAYLQKYEALASLACQQLSFECMWHLQSALHHLQGAEREQAVRYILDVQKATPRVCHRKLRTNWKYHLWYALFAIAPVQTATLRNRLRMGI